MLGRGFPFGDVAVAASRGSAVLLAIALRIAAASATVRACGPTVSCVCEIGTTPARETRPTVGLIPTTPFALAGQTMLPSVSVPMETAVKFADAAAPDPELEPQGLRSVAYGLLHCPPRPDHPLEEKKERKLAHSLRVVLPRITAPASRRWAAMVASRGAGVPTRPSDPAAVCILSLVSVLSLSRTGMPCSGPRALPAWRCASRAVAMALASGLTWITELTFGQLWSMVWMRDR